MKPPFSSRGKSKSRRGVERRAVVLKAARRHAWVAPLLDGKIGEERRLRVLGGVDLAPGDILDSNLAGAIRSRLERRTVLRRKTVRGEQVLATNIDDLMVISAAGIVEGGEGLVARCIAAARAEGISEILVFNKMDLDADRRMRHEADGWAKRGFEVHVVSALGGEGMTSLKSRIRGRWAALVGASGVGKSTLINALAEGVSLRTSSVGEHGRGRHTTSLGCVVPWEGGLLIDLPGVRSFGLFDDDALAAAYPEIEAAGLGCRFADCAHGPEPGCAVKAAVERNDIEAERLAGWQRVRKSVREGSEGRSRSGRS